MPSIVLFPSLLSSPIWKHAVAHLWSCSQLYYKTPRAREDPTRGATHPSLLLSSGDKLIDSPPPIYRPGNCFEEIWRQREMWIWIQRVFANFIIIQFVRQINKEIHYRFIGLRWKLFSFYIIALHCNPPKWNWTEISTNRSFAFCQYFICWIQTPTWSQLMRNIFKTWIYSIGLKRVNSH